MIGLARRVVVVFFSLLTLLLAVLCFRDDRAHDTLYWRAETPWVNWTEGVSHEQRIELHSHAGALHLDWTTFNPTLALPLIDWSFALKIGTPRLPDAFKSPGKRRFGKWDGVSVPVDVVTKSEELDDMTHGDAIWPVKIVSVPTWLALLTSTIIPAIALFHRDRQRQNHRSSARQRFIAWSRRHPRLCYFLFLLALICLWLCTERRGVFTGVHAFEYRLEVIVDEGLIAIDIDSFSSHRGFYPSVSVFCNFNGRDVPPERDWIIAPAGIGATEIAIPFWLLVVLCIARPISHRISRWIIRTFPEGHCRRCGYDLRASSERCPECGLLRSEETVSHHGDRLIRILSWTSVMMGLLTIAVVIGILRKEGTGVGIFNLACWIDSGTAEFRTGSMEICRTSAWLVPVCTSTMAVLAFWFARSRATRVLGPPA